MLNIMALFGGLGAFVPVTHTYDSGTAATETIPSGATQVVIKLWGGGGSGGRGYPAGEVYYNGGASGAYSSKTLALTSSDWGKTFTYTVGELVAGISTNTTVGNNGNTSTITNGTYGTSLSMSCTGGEGGQVSGAATPGTASGGTTNTSGNAHNSNIGAGAPNGGGDSSPNGTTPGGGGAGVEGGTSGTGAAGRAQFIYT